MNRSQKESLNKKMQIDISKKSNFFIFIPILLAIYFSWLNRYFYLDDVLIYARYIENFLNGDGLVYNIGEKFNGLTSPFFTYISISTSYLFDNVVYGLNSLSALFFILSIWIFQRIFNYVSNEIFVVISSIMFITSPYTYSVFGMETYLFIFLIGLNIYLFLTEKYYLLLTTMALLLLTRNEGIFLILALVIEHFRLKREFPKISYFILPIILVVSHFSFNYIYYGALLPETGPAKIWQGMSGLFGTNKPLFIMNGWNIAFRWVFVDSKILLTIVTLFAIFGSFKMGKTSLNIISITFLILLLSFYSFLNIPNYHWYDAPFIIFLFYYFAVGLSYFYTLVMEKFTINRYLLSTFIAFFVTYIVYHNFKNLSFNKPFHAYNNVATWLKENTSKDSSIGLGEIGIVGYFSHRYIIDIFGLVNPYNAKYIGEKRFDKWLSKYHPDYILVHEPLWGLESGVKEAVQIGEYKEYTKFTMDGYKMLASKHLELSDDNLINPYGEKYQSKQIDIKLQDYDDNVIYGFNIYLSTNYFLNIKGWAFKKNATIDKTKKYIVLKNDKDRYIYSTKSEVRKDITTYFKAENLDNSGFEAAILKKHIPVGSYDIYLLLIEDNNKQHMISIDKNITIEKFNTL